MFNADQINHQIKKTAKDMGIADVNRVRIILTLERVIARLVNNPFFKERLIFGGGFVLLKSQVQVVLLKMLMRSLTE